MFICAGWVSPFILSKLIVPSWSVVMFYIAPVKLPLVWFFGLNIFSVNAFNVRQLHMLTESWDRWPLLLFWSNRLVSPSFINTIQRHVSVYVVLRWFMNCDSWAIKEDWAQSPRYPAHPVIPTLCWFRRTNDPAGMNSSPSQLKTMAALSPLLVMSTPATIEAVINKRGQAFWALCLELTAR